MSRTSGHRRKRSSARARQRAVVSVLAVAMVAGGAALLAHAITLLTAKTPAESGEPSDTVTTTQAVVSTSASSVVTTTAPTTTVKTTFGTSYVLNTTKQTTKQTTKKTGTAATALPVEGHFVQDRSTAPWNLVLANPWNPLPDSFDDNIEVKGGLRGNSNEKVDVRAYESLKAMLNDGKQYNLRICSGYRTVEKQAYLFNNRVKNNMNKGMSREEAEKEVAKDTARPGTSEHNTGLAADILGGSYSHLSESFSKTDAYKWLIAHCADYGYILRYPKGKEGITGYTYEPWHYRYVGKEVASYIMKNNLTLEEYLEQQAN